jgi:hypothetical protein
MKLQPVFDDPVKTGNHKLKNKTALTVEGDNFLSNKIYVKRKITNDMLPEFSFVCMQVPAMA